jgi:hypothetical protein
LLDARLKGVETRVSEIEVSVAAQRTKEVTLTKECNDKIAYVKQELRGQVQLKEHYVENLRSQLADLKTTIGDEVGLMENEIWRLKERHVDEIKNVQVRVREILKTRGLGLMNVKEEYDIIKRVNEDIVQELDEKRKRAFGGK